MTTGRDRFEGFRLALEEHGLAIPDDISLIGYDAVPFSETIGLTTVAQPAYEMGKNAALLLLDVVNCRIGKPQTIVLRPSIVIRRSCQKKEGEP